MEVPASGLVFVPLALGIFIFAPSRLEELLIYLAVFQGAAVLNIGGSFSIGLSPYFFVAGLIAARTTAKWLVGKVRFRSEEFTQRHLRIMLLFVGWCVISAFALPVLFQGIAVDNPRAGIDASYYTQLPLKWSWSNAGQAGYMALNFFVLIALSNLYSQRAARRLQNAFTYSGVIVLAVGAYQLACHRLGLPFPAWFFNSNATWSQSYNQVIGGIPRVSATFVEPSDAGGFLSCWSLFELTLAASSPERTNRHWTFAVIGCMMLIATASSTGYVTAAIVWLTLGGRLVFDAITRGRIGVRSASVVGALLIVATLFLTTSDSGSTLDAVIWTKSGSASGLHRMATLTRAISVFLSTYGLGTGLGSNRAASLFFYVGSNLGLFGILAFGYPLVQILGQAARQLRTTSSTPASHSFLRAATVAFAANVITLFVSGAEITQPRLWIVWGLLVVALRTLAENRDTFDESLPEHIGIRSPILLEH